MRLWLSRGSEISVCDQLVTQVMLSILSGDLRPGQRLPSTRELARRFHVHANTVSAGYRRLQRENWVEFRKGSGIYVKSADKAGASEGIDQLIAEFFSRARKLGTPLSVIRSKMAQWLQVQVPDHFVLIEPDPQLSQIVVTELKANLQLPVHPCTMTEYECDPAFTSGIPLALSLNTGKIPKALRARAEIVTLHLRSAADSLAPYLPVPKDALVAVASSWPPFVKTARTMLIAAGFHPDSLLVCDASQANWQRGLEQASAVVCDSLLASSLNGRGRILTFRLLSDASLLELKSYEQYLVGKSDGCDSNM